MHGFEAGEAAEASVLDEKRKNEPLADLAVESGKLAAEIGPYSILALNIREKNHRPVLKNLALEAKATASSESTIGPHFGAESANDDRLHTRWQSEAWTRTRGDEEQWLQLEWEELRTVSEVRIVWGSSFGIEYDLESSIDGRNWKVLSKTTDGSGGTDRIDFDPEKIRFLRMNGRRGTDAISAYSIAEIEVYGSD